MFLRLALGVTVTLRQEISGRCIGAESCENGAAITSQVGYHQAASEDNYRDIL